MAEPIVMPKLAMAMQEGQVVEWLAEEGAWVEKGQMVMVVETEKVTYECEAPVAGLMHRTAELNVIVPVFEPVAYLAQDPRELATLQDGRQKPAQAQTPRSPSPPETASPKRRERIVASPVAKKLARQHSLDLRTIEGSGPGGRIIKADVERALARAKEPEVPAPSQPIERLETLPVTALPPTEVAGRRVLATLPLIGMRKSIAEHMHSSLSTAAQLSTMGEVDASELIRFREALLLKEDELELRISFTDLLVMIIARAVQAAPAVNSAIVGDEIRIWADVNVGVAVALERGPYESGLIVPVIRGANRLTLAEIARTRRDLVSRARENLLTADDVSAGTITLSNLGMLSRGWTVSTPILNQPETIIVQSGAIVERPVARDGTVVVRPVMTLSVTFDHRVIDGVPAMGFYNKMAELIENPAYLLL